MLGLPRLLPAILAALPLAAQSPQLLPILEKELRRNFELLQEKADPKPYFMAYEVTDLEARQIVGIRGEVSVEPEGRRRQLDVSVRVGSRELDNYYVLEGALPRFTSGLTLPIEDLEMALRRPLWLETNRVYQAGARRLQDLQTRVRLRLGEGASVPAFSMESPVASISRPELLKLDVGKWVPVLARLSGFFRQYPQILHSTVSLAATRDVRTLVNTEGTRLQHGRLFYRIVLSVAGNAPDGSLESLNESFEGLAEDSLPDEAALREAAQRLARKLDILLSAPEMEPYVGPAILSGRAAGVFFHEIFGHRVEGHRLRDDSDGQTFAKSLGEAVLPEFLSVRFDPTVKRLAGTDLNGWYEYDDEGVKARPVVVVEHGTLKTFLMSRTPVEGILQSNGHGRRQPGAEVVSRQSTLIVESEKRVPEEELRRLLLAEVRAQSKPYGLYFEEVTGGYTTTSRRGFQAFKVIPVLVYRVYADGRPDELVRGADIVGTPLASFRKILAAGDRMGVFNGYCGAESGSVPVSAVAPALLISEIEVQKKPASRSRAPILPPPSLQGKQ